MGGSSPRARGTFVESSFERLRRRFIPAGAGNISSLSLVLLQTTVHPRGRGEHPHRPVCQGGGPGSSPRARGTFMGDHGQPAGIRFIPAGAGNIYCDAGTFRAVTVHPRGRGEHSTKRSGLFLMRGSSPRARGTYEFDSCDLIDERFIPAGAGNMVELISHPHHAAVHPRGRGEHYLSLFTSKSASGSSPRARGTFTGSWLMLCGYRFIPAGAGNIPSQTG